MGTASSPKYTAVVRPGGAAVRAAGVAGPRGLPGPVAPQPTFVFTQATPAAVWTVVHGLGKYPSVTVVDSAGLKLFGDVRYDSDDAVTLTFGAAFAGVAYLN